MQLPRIFALACELGMAQGWENISMDPGCKEIQVDAHWWFAINPHNEVTATSQGAKVPPQSIYFKFNGWPAGCVDAGGGVLAAGAIANEDTLGAALEAAIRTYREARPSAALSKKGDPTPIGGKRKPFLK